MKETFLYHGHSIDLDLCDIACARIQWTNFIDRLYCVQGTTDSSGFEAVRFTALALARRSIDVLDAMRSGLDDGGASPARSCVVAAMMEHGPQRFAAADA